MTFIALLAAGGCKCRSPIEGLGPPVVEVTPARVVFPDTYVGKTRSMSVDVAHLDGSPASLGVGPVQEPFSATPPALELSRGERATVRVAFAPQAPGAFAAKLRVGETEVQLEAQALAQPACMAGGACVSSSFDTSAEACVETPLPNGTACSSRCVMNGTCAAAVCIGAFAGCDDMNACTVDACSEADGGCSHSPRACPAPTGACRLARCDTQTGCFEEDAPDGTLCGVDDCLATTVDVCLSGQCVQRPRPDDGRCANRWIPTQLDNDNHALVYDATRQREVLFGTYTWESDGTAWTLRIPAASPSQRYEHAMAWDSSRDRTVLFGGATGVSTGQVRLSDTWEWDGTTWVQRHALTPPPPRRQHAMAYDEARQRLVLFGGWGGSATGTANDFVLGDTWEWNGTAWSQRSPAISPPVLAMHSMVYDSVRKRTVLFGGFSSDGDQSATWEWDGASWTQRTPPVSPPKRSSAAMTFDTHRGRVVLYGGTYLVNGSSLSRRDTWEWDGARWTELTPAVSPPPGGLTMAYDATKRRSVLVAGSQTWEWDGALWTRRPGNLTARLDFEVSVAWDAARQQAVTFTAMPLPTETWLWSSAGWRHAMPTTSPSMRWRHEVVYDAARQRVVLYGGAGNGTLVDTWEWDGTNWSQHTTPVNPGVRDRHAMAYDPVRQRVVLFGGITGDAATWEWNGTAWQSHVQASGPEARYWHALAWDGVRQRVVLIGGVANNLPLDDVWQWDGTAWTQLPSMPGGGGMVMAAYDEGRKVVVVPGATTREWDGTTWTTRTPLTPPPQRCTPIYETAVRKVVCFSANSSTPYLYLP